MRIPTYAAVTYKAVDANTFLGGILIKMTGILGTGIITLVAAITFALYAPNSHAQVSPTVVQVNPTVVQLNPTVGPGSAVVPILPKIKPVVNPIKKPRGDRGKSGSGKTKKLRKIQLKVLHQTKRKVIAELLIPHLTFRKVKTPDGVFDRISPDIIGPQFMRHGTGYVSLPELPLYSFPVAVPMDGEIAKIDIDPVGNPRKHNVRLYPVQPPNWSNESCSHGQRFTYNKATYYKDFFEVQDVLDPTGIQRANNNIQKVSLNVVDYYPEDELLLSYRRIRITLHFKSRSFIYRTLIRPRDVGIKLDEIDKRYFNQPRPLERLLPNFKVYWSSFAYVVPKDSDSGDTGSRSGGKAGTIDSPSRGVKKSSAKRSVTFDFSEYDTDAGAQLLIIYHPDLLQAAQNLKTHKDNVEAYKTEIVSTNEIYQWKYGAAVAVDGDITAVDIKDYIKDYYNTKINVPKWLLLLGDTNLIPTHYTDQMNIPDNMQNTGDIFFGQVDDDGSSIPPVGIGRLPVKEFQEAINLVNKIKEYDMSHNNGSIQTHSFYKRITFCEGSLDADSQSTVSTVKNSIPTSFYIKQFNASTPPATMSTYFQNRTALICHRGPAGGEGWYEPLFTNQELSLLLNSSTFKLPFVLSMNSTSGFFDDEQYCLSPTDGSVGCVVPWAEQLFIPQKKGAIGIIGPSRSTIETDNNTLMLGAFDAMFPVGAATMVLKTGGDILNHAKLAVVNSAASQDDIRQQITIYNLLGDPSLEIALRASAN